MLSLVYPAFRSTSCMWPSWPHCLAWECISALPAAGEEWTERMVTAGCSMLCTVLFAVYEELVRATRGASGSATTQLNLEARSVFPKDGHHVLDRNHEQSVVAFEVDRMPCLGLNRTRSYCRIG